MKESKDVNVDDVGRRIMLLRIAHDLVCQKEIK